MVDIVYYAGAFFQNNTDCSGMIFEVESLARLGADNIKMG
jgi:hypothetical protein